MKKLITKYTFLPTARKIILDEYTSIDGSGLLLITNVTDNIIIYIFSTPAKGASVSGNTITLTYDTTGMSGGDDLQIFYEDDTMVVFSANIGELLENLTDEVKKLRTVFEMVHGISLN